MHLFSFIIIFDTSLLIPYTLKDDDEEPVSDDHSIDPIELSGGFEGDIILSSFEEYQLLTSVRFQLIPRLIVAFRTKNLFSYAQNWLLYN